jgi:RimJ/RimL family protein N-acetyltransferase
MLAIDQRQIVGRMVAASVSLCCMEARLHDDIDEFWSLAEPIISADPVRNTVALSAVRMIRETPDPSRGTTILLTISDGGTIVGAALRTPPYPLVTSAIPLDAIEVAASVLAPVAPDLIGASGPRDTAEAFADAWAKRTGVTVKEMYAGRLYRLGTLEPPAVPGHARRATEADVPLLAGWRRDFEMEAFGREREPGKGEANVRRSFALGAIPLLWEHGGRPVSHAMGGKPFHGMSRVGPVYTSPEERGHGYGSAVTAAVTQAAMDAGAEQVVLFTDLANLVSNSIYQRIGYRPVLDSTELEFS